MMITYGHEVAPEGDFFVKLADEALESFSVGGEPGRFLVDFFPLLKYVPDWFPGAGFKRKAKAWRKLSDSMLNVPYEMTKPKILDGTARPSMMQELIENHTDKDGRIEGEDDIAACTAVTYGGGADTTVSSILSFLLALVLYPEVRIRGQEELDRVVGRDRLPTIDDRPALPYIEGIFKETVRWNPVVPGGAVHSLDVDDVYNGYFLPAGTMVLPNQWAMLHDEAEYPEPFKFMPERWILKDGQKEPLNLVKAAFGFGRRICPGKSLAEDSIYIAIITILATLDVQKAVDAHGQLITPPGDYHKEAISHPKPFECSITRRSPEVVTMLNRAIENEK
jgi:cytochrome P450